MENRSKHWNTMVDILDGQFPKGECKERGRALMMLTYMEMMLTGTEFNNEGHPQEKKKECCEKCSRFYCIQMKTKPNKTGYECVDKDCLCHSQPSQAIEEIEIDEPEYLDKWTYDEHEEIKRKINEIIKAFNKNIKVK